MPGLDDLLCFTVYSAAHAFLQAYRPLLDRLGLTYPQYLVLLVLWREGEVGMGRLGERLRLDSGTLTPLLKRMEAAGLVARRRDERDERQVRVRLTEAGRALEAKAQDMPERILCAGGGDAEAFREARDRLAAIRDALNAADR